MPSDPQKLKISKQIDRSDILMSIARLPDSNRIFVGSSDGKIYDLDVMADKPEFRELVGHDSYVTGLVHVGETLISAAYDRQLIWWDRETGKPVRSVEAHQRWIRQLISTPDQQQAITVADDMVCRIWDTKTGKQVRELRGHQEKTPHHFPSMLYACAVSPDGKYLATGDRVGHVVVWDLATGKELTSLETPLMYTWDPKARIHSIGGIRSLAFSPDSSLLAIGGTGQINNIDHLEALSRVEIFAWEKQQRTHEFKGSEHKGLVEHLVFHPENQWLLAAGGDHNGFIKFFDLEKSSIIKQAKAPMHVHEFTVNETYDTIYAAGHGKLVVWALTG